MTLRALLRPLLPLLVANVLSACTTPAHHDLDERSATELAVVLGAAGIPASRRANDSGTWDVHVARTQIDRALAVLASQGLPRQAIARADLGSSGLVASADDNLARRAQAIATDLERTLVTLDGVVDAFVHVVLAAPATRFSQNAPDPTRASVVLRHRADRPAPEEQAVRAIVQGAVEGIAWDDISVVWNAVTLPQAPDFSLAQVGPFVVSADSAPALRATLTALASLIALAGLLLLRPPRGDSEVRRD